MADSKNYIKLCIGIHRQVAFENPKWGVTNHAGHIGGSKVALSLRITLVFNLQAPPMLMAV